MAQQNLVSVFFTDTRSYTYFGKSVDSNGQYKTTRLMLVVSEGRNQVLKITPYIDGMIGNTVYSPKIDTTVTANWDKEAENVARRILGVSKYKLQGLIEDFVVVNVPFYAAHRYGIRFSNPMNDKDNKVCAYLCDFKNIFNPDAPMKNYGRLEYTLGNRKQMTAFVKKQLTEVLLSEIYDNDPNGGHFDRRKLAIQGMAECCKSPIKFNYIKYVD